MNLGDHLKLQELGKVVQNREQDDGEDVDIAGPRLGKLKNCHDKNIFSLYLFCNFVLKAYPV